MSRKRMKERWREREREIAFKNVNILAKKLTLRFEIDPFGIFSIL